MRTYRIGNPAANHRRKEKNGWKKYGFGDQIQLEEADAKRLTHLRLEPLTGTKVVEPEDELILDDEPPQQNGDGGDEGNESGDSSADNTPSDEEIQALIEEVDNSRVDDGSFERVRDKVVALDLFDDLPETKKGVKEALELLLD